MPLLTSIAYIGSTGSWLECLEELQAGVHPGDFWLPPEWEKPLTMPLVKEIHRFANQQPVGKEKLVAIPFADLLKPEVANALLKLLEEPPHALRVVLFAESGRLLPTIRSRVQVKRLTARTGTSKTDYQQWYDMLQAYQTGDPEERQELQQLLYLTPLLHLTIQANVVREAYEPK